MPGTPSFRTADISLPVLQSSTCHRVSPQLERKTNNSTTASDSDAGGSPQLQRSGIKPHSSFQSQEHLGVKKIKTKYASPEAIIANSTFPPSDALADTLPATMSTQLILTNSNSNLVGSDVMSDVNGFHAQNVLIDPSRKNRINDSVSAFSDTSSDISDATTSVPSAGSTGSTVMTTNTMKIPVLEGITDQDIQQVEIFYRSHKTEVQVCTSLVNMYVSSPKTLDRMPAGQVSASTGESNAATLPDPSTMSMEDWEFVKTGIPTIILNTGEHIRNRKLTLVLAERGTGFTLWEDVLSHLTRYQTPHPNFHTLSLSTDATRLVGFSFDEGKAANDFADAIRTFLANPDDEELKLNKKKKKKSAKKEKKPKYKPPRKIDISQPCCFVHVTKLERPTLMGVTPYTFPPPPSGADLAQMNAVTRSKSESSELSECSRSSTPSVL